MSAFWNKFTLIIKPLAKNLWSGLILRHPQYRLLMLYTSIFVFSFKIQISTHNYLHPACVFNSRYLTWGFDFRINNFNEDLIPCLPWRTYSAFPNSSNTWKWKSPTTSKLDKWKIISSVKSHNHSWKESSHNSRDNSLKTTSTSSTHKRRSTMCRWSWIKSWCKNITSPNKTLRKAKSSMSSTVTLKMRLNYQNRKGTTNACTVIDPSRLTRRFILITEAVRTKSLMKNLMKMILFRNKRMWKIKSHGDSSLWSQKGLNKVTKNSIECLLQRWLRTTIKKRKKRSLKRRKQMGKDKDPAHHAAWGATSSLKSEEWLIFTSILIFCQNHLLWTKKLNKPFLMNWIPIEHKIIFTLLMNWEARRLKFENFKK